MNKTLLPFPGAKTRAIHTLAPLFEKTFPKATRVYSPFLGDGSFEIYLAHEMSLKVYVNDKFCLLMDFWNAMKSTPERKKMVTFIRRWFPLTREQYTMWSKRCRDYDQLAQSYSLGVRGAVLYLLTRASFSSRLAGGWSKAQAERSVTDIEQWYENADGDSTFQHLTFQCEDWTAFLARYRSAGRTPRTPLFLDPPYKQADSRQHLYGFSGELHRSFDHVGLRKALGKRTYWMLCYNDSAEIRRMYRGYKIIKVKWAYSMHNNAQRPDKDHSSKEIVILCNGHDVV